MNTQIANTTAVSTAAQNDASDLIPGTTWTYGDALEMAVECRTEARLFRTRRSAVRRPRHSTTVRSARSQAAFLKQTGWRWQDAVSESLACARETRSRFEQILATA